MQPAGQLWINFSPFPVRRLSWGPGSTIFHCSVHPQYWSDQTQEGFWCFEHSALYITLRINLMEYMHGFATIKIGSRLDGSIWAVLVPRLQQLCGYAVSAIPHPCSTVWMGRKMINISERWGWDLSSSGWYGGRGEREPSWMPKGTIPVFSSTRGDCHLSSCCHPTLTLTSQNISNVTIAIIKVWRRATASP